VLVTITALRDFDCSMTISDFDLLNKTTRYCLASRAPSDPIMHASTAWRSQRASAGARSKGADRD
jgi:hypothetical protein